MWPNDKWWQACISSENLPESRELKIRNHYYRLAIVIQGKSKDMFFLTLVGYILAQKKLFLGVLDHFKQKKKVTDCSLNVLLWLWPQCDVHYSPLKKVFMYICVWGVCRCLLWLTEINKSALTVFFYQHLQVCVCFRDWGQGKSCMWDY